MAQTTYGASSGKSNANVAPDHKLRDQTTSRSAQDAKQKVASAADGVKQMAVDATEDLKQQAIDATNTAKQKIRETADQAKESGRKYASEKKERIAEEIGVFSGAIRKAAGKLHDEQHDSIASYVDAAAEQLDHLRDSLQSKDIGQLFHDAQCFTRRRPEIVYGGLFIAGLVAVRFLKATKPAPKPTKLAGRDLNDDSQRPLSAFGHAPRGDLSQPPIGYRGVQSTFNPQGSQL